MNKLVVIIFSVMLAFACNTKSTNESKTVSAPDTISTVLKVAGMTCEHCEMTVQGSVKDIAGLIGIKANHKDSTTAVVYDASQTNLQEISTAIEGRGYKVIQ